MKAGPKGSVKSPLPLWTQDLPRDGGQRVCAFAEKYLSVPSGTDALDVFRFRDWQRELVDAVFDNPRPRMALWSLPRGHGKSSLAAALSLYCLFGDREESAQVLCMASDERQAGITWNMARRMVELSRPLMDRCLIYSDRIVVPATDSVMTVLPSEPGALVGWNPSLAIVDELAFVTDDTWEAIVGATGKRRNSLVLAISTPAGDRDNVMWRLRERGLTRPDDPLFRFREYSAPVGCAIDDEEAWKIACPALDDFLHRDGLRSALTSMRESSFRRYRLGQWTDSESTWIPWDVWASRADPDRALSVPGPHVLSFDGSYSGDSTALTRCTFDLHVSVVGIWEHDGSTNWTVNRTKVNSTVVDALADPDCVALYCDPPLWRAEMDAWSRQFPGKVFEFPMQSRQRMGPATDRFRQAVVNGEMTHDGNQRLAAHVANCVAESSEYGDLVRKEHRRSPKKIDSAVAAIVALDRANWHKQNQRPKPRTAVLR